MDDFSEMDDVDMVEFLEDGDLSDCGGGDAFLLAFESDFFEGEDLVGLLVWVRKGVPLAM